MASFHDNFAVFNTVDPLDDLLMDTVADLKNPPRVPHVHPEHNFHTQNNIKLRTKGYPLSSTTGFVKE